MMLSLTCRATVLAALVALAPHALAQAEPDIAVTPTAIDFGEVGLGEKVTSPVVITNQGSAPLQFRSIGVTSFGFSFEFEEGGGFDLLDPLAPGASRTIDVAFRPQTARPYEGAFAIETNDPDEPRVEVALAGVGIQRPDAEPDIAVTPLAIDFGRVPVGEFPEARVFFENEGGRLLTVSFLDTTGPFSIDPSDRFGFLLSPGAQTFVDVSFAPTGAGTFEGTLVIESDDPDEPVVEVALSGTRFDPDDFIDVEAGAEVDGREVTLTAIVTNDGDTPRDLDLWAVISTPDERRLFRGPLEITAPAGGAVMTVRMEIIDLGRPAGTYEVNVRVGDYPVDAVAEDATSFVLAPVASLSAYPNPFNPSTEVRFDLDAPADVTLEVFDALGRRVVVLADGPMAAGPQARSFDAAGLASGLYLARLRVGDTVTVRRLTLLK